MVTSTLHYQPLSATELQTLQHWQPENFSSLRDRAAAHDLSPQELLAEFPPDHRTEEFVSQALPDLEISHRISQLHAPHLADEPVNIVLELRSDLGGLNQARGSRLMGYEEARDVQFQTEVYLDAKAAELLGSDPFLRGADLGDAPDPQLDPDDFSHQLEAAISAAGWQQGHSVIADHVLSFFAELGVPVATVLARGASSVWPFLRSINWRRFCSDWRYSLNTLSRAMKVWREGGWKEACRALVLGVMVAMLPGLSSFVAALGLTGLGALGVRWLANRRFMHNTPLAGMLHRLADVLQACQQFLSRVFALIEKVVDVVIDATRKAVKRLVTGLSAGASQVMAVCTSIAKSAVSAARAITTTTGRVAQGLFGWISGWFGGRQPAYGW